MAFLDRHAFQELAKLSLQTCLKLLEVDFTDGDLNIQVSVRSGFWAKNSVAWNK